MFKESSNEISDANAIDLKNQAAKSVKGKEKPKEKEKEKGKEVEMAASTLLRKVSFKKDREVKKEGKDIIKKIDQMKLTKGKINSTAEKNKTPGMINNSTPKPPANESTPEPTEPRPTSPREAQPVT